MLYKSPRVCVNVCAHGVVCESRQFSSMTRTTNAVTDSIQMNSKEQGELF